MKKHLLLLLITIILALIPFFWFKPGEVNLGGDSSRLYFYDPINYLRNFSLYSIYPSQTGEEAVNFYTIPFVLFLLLLKEILRLPYLLINVFHGFMLAASFLFVYAIIRELIKDIGAQGKDSQLTAILGGLFYSLTPVIGYNWDKALIPHNQVFLNPLIFFLLLRYVRTQHIIYALIALLITVIFAPNFSYASAPSFFAFYPFALLYLFLYGRFVKKISFQWKHILTLILLFIALHAFHLVPQVANLFERENIAFQRVFTEEGASEALSYFSRIYPTYRLSRNLAALPQGVPPLFAFDFLLFAFPAILLVGLFLNLRLSKDKIVLSKNLLLIFIFFLITLFFATANITSIGAWFYKALFKVPGFGMFRNFFGQFMYIFYFFYSVLVGLASYYVFSMMGRRLKVMAASLIFGLLLVNGWPFIKGELVNLPIYQSNNVKVPFKMDPEFERALNYLRKDPVDGKILTLPLTDFGYQVLSGVQVGAYIGPSMIGYLTGKEDFPGYVGFGHLSDEFLRSARIQDYDSLNNLFAILNINYIFYNSNPYIYDENFPHFPYNTIGHYFPNQTFLGKFVEGLAVDKKIDFGQNYHLYKVHERKYLPHIFVAKQAVLRNAVPFSLLKVDSRLAYFTENDMPAIDKEMFTASYTVGVKSDGDMISLLKDRKVSPMHISSSAPAALYPLIHPLLVLSEKKHIGDITKSQKIYPTRGVSSLLRPEDEANEDNMGLFTYNINPFLKDSDYEILVAKDSLLERSDNSKAKIFVGDEEIPLSDKQDVDEWIKFDYKSSSNDPFSLTLSLLHDESPPNLVIWKSLLQSTNYLDFEIDGPMLNFVAEAIKRYADWEPSSIYFVSFNYLIKGSPGGFREYRTIVETSRDTKPVYMRIFLDEPWQIGAIPHFVDIQDIEIKDFTVTHLTHPQIIVRNVKERDLKAPVVIFTKINPTKYEIKVKDAKEAYILVFLEAFNTDWKLYLSDRNGEEETLASYFDGEVREGKHKNAFLDRNIFETLGKMPTADKRHLLVNTYANAWYILLSDVDGRTDYTLILEMTSQRLFYLGSLITLPALAICIVWLVMVSLRLPKLRKERRHATNS